MSELIHEVTEVGAFRTDDTPPRLIVEVSGMAATPGWTNVRLERQTYLTPPEDGVQEFDLVGDRPADVAPELLTDVLTDYAGEDEEWITAVRVHGAQNDVVADVMDDDDVDADDDDDDLDDDADAPSTEAAA
jgi:hypothetical protein